jgi:predicted dehydrogenase
MLQHRLDTAPQQGEHTMDGTLRAGIIGAGFITVRGHVPGYRAAGGVEIIALCDLNEQRAQTVAQEIGIPHVYTDYREMLATEKLDIVSVCSPNAFHAQMTIDALTAGAHVLCEKPMALTYADACSMIDAARRSRRVLTVGFHNRYRPEMVAAKAIVGKGGLGEIYYVRASMLRRRGIPGYGSWFTNKELAGGGALMDIGCHITDLALWLMGHPKPTTVVGSIYAHFGPRGKGLGTWGSDHYPLGARFDVDDLATALVRFENGATLGIEASWAGHGTDGQRLQLFGTEGGIEYNDKLFGAESPLRFFSEDGGELREEPIDVPKESRTAYESEVSDWVRRLREGQPPVTTPEEAAMAVMIIESVYRSAATGREVVLA